MIKNIAFTLALLGTAQLGWANDSQLPIVPDDHLEIATFPTVNLRKHFTMQSNSGECNPENLTDDCFDQFSSADGNNPHEAKYQYESGANHIYYNAYAISDTELAHYV